MSSELKCNVCFDFYNSSDKKPILLNCGHSLCKSCLVRLENRNCSTCRSEITQEDLEDIPVNQALIRLAENRIEEKNDDNNICKDHNLPKNCECTSHRTMICAVCGLMKHKQCENKFTGEKISTKKRKFQQEHSEEIERINKMFDSSISQSTKLNKEKEDIVKRINELETRIIHIREESVRTKADIEMESEGMKVIELWQNDIQVQTETVQNSSSNSEFELNKRLLVNLLKDFDGKFGEPPPAKRRRMDEGNHYIVN